MGGGFRWFAAGVASWFAAWGMQSVLFSWLVVGELRATPDWVGVVQTSTMLPALFLLLWGGATADRRDPRRFLVRLQLLAAVPAALLAAVVAAGRLTLPVLVLFGLSVGTLAAFVMPSRDALLSRVAGGDMMRVVTGMTAVQFGAQAAGTLLAGLARWVGSAPMLAAQAVLAVVGALCTARLPAGPPDPGRTGGASTLAEIAAGLGEVLRTPRLRAPILLVLAVGVLFVGPFIVVFPLLVRDVYGGGVGQLSLVLMLFPLGTIIGSVAIRRRGGIRRKGRAALLGLTTGAALLATVGLGLPFPGMVVATLAWGLAGAVFINCSRTLYQEAAPPAHRGRVLSVYQLAFMGAAPLGALLAGAVSARLGPLGALVVSAAVMQVVVVLAWALTDTTRME
jgi:predicted MFS family arabinose efflux permease